MNIVSNPGDWWDDEPTDAELMAIDAEWPSIEAELHLLDTELARHTPVSEVTPTVHRRTRRRRRRVLAPARCITRATGVAL